MASVEATSTKDMVLLNSLRADITADSRLLSWFNSFELDFAEQLVGVESNVATDLVAPCVLVVLTVFFG